VALGLWACGTVGRAHGLKGEFYLDLLPNGRAYLTGGERFFMERPGVSEPQAVVLARAGGTEERPLLKLEGLDSREAVVALHGAVILASGTGLDEGVDHYPVSELLGARVVTGGVELGVVTEETLKEMMEHYPPTYVIGKGNPADVTGGANSDDYRYAIQKFMDDPNIDIVMPWFVFQDDPLDEGIVKHLANFCRKGKKPLLVGANGGPYTAKMSGLIEKHHVPVYDDIRNWVAAASALRLWGKQMSRKI